jgi:hypothetical protein
MPMPEPDPEPLDPFASLGFNLDGDDDDDIFGAMGGVAAPSSAPAPMTSGDDGALDLDKQLEMLLMADQSAEESFEMKDISSSIPTQSVYDPEVDGMGSVQYVKGSFTVQEEAKTKLFADMSRGKMAAVFVIGVLIIALGAITAIFAHSGVQAQQVYIDAVSHFTPIEIPTGMANNASFIFVNERGEIGESTFSLMRINAAYSGTFFYFDEYFDPDDYYIFLFNQARRLYARAGFSSSGDTGFGTVLKFAPLSGNTLFLTLHVQCKNSHEYVRFNYRFTTPPVHQTPVFITRPAYIAGDNPDGTGLVLRNAIFDSASSRINFSYTPNMTSAGFRMNRHSDEPLVRLHDMQNMMIVNPVTNHDAVVYFEEFDIYMGTATFGPILNLESNVEFIFYDLMYFYPNPVFDVTPQELFENDQDYPIPVETGNFTLMLEGMTQQDMLVVLTLHGLDQSNRRQTTNLDISLHIDTGAGVIVLPGYVRKSPRGSDVLFDIRPHFAALRDVHIENYSLVINWVEFEVPSVRIPVRVSQFYNMQTARRHAVQTAMHEAFMSLLAYKSGEITRENIIGISPQAITEIFAPTDIEGRPMYAVSVSMGDMISNYDFVGVVEVEWTNGSRGADLIYFRETLKITARSRDAIWAVVNIEVL